MSEGDEEETMSSERELSEAQIRLAEAHRGFVREMDRSLGNAYGRGGGVVLLVFAVAVAVGAFQGWLGEVTLWLATVTLTLCSLYVVRKRIYALRDRLRQRVEKYCEVNDLSSKLLRAYYESEDMYPFFVAMYEEKPSVQGPELAGQESTKKLDAQ